MGDYNNTVNNDKYTINFKGEVNFSVDIAKEIFDKIKDRESDVNKLKGIGIFILQEENKNDIDITGFFDSSKRVPNVERYILKKRKCGCYYEIDEGIKRKKDFVESDYCDSKPSNDKTSKSIVIILESPHQYEYNEDFEPIAPAQGATGKGIEFYIEFIIYHLIKRENIILDDDEYNVIICNPVQYQSSLYHLHNNSIEGKYKTLRNRVWKKLFDDETKKDFINRVKSYNPKLIINACTYELKNYVQKELDKEFSQSSDVEMIKSYHPSSWGCLGIEVKK
ncbi:MAG: hypothetical protein ACLTK7_06130 [Clostridium paraputrificum]